MGYVLEFLDCKYKDNNKDQNYKFELGEKYQLYGKNKKNRNVDKLNQGLSDDLLAEYVFTDVYFCKEVYQPGYIEFTIQVKKDLGVDFRGSVNLSYNNDIVAKSYYIFEKTTRSEYVTFKAYSADKFLTIDKFNYAHRGKRLVTPLSIDGEAKAGGIVYTILGMQDGVKTTKAIEKFKNLIDKPSGTPWIKNLNHIGESSKDVEEAVLPYCVQYDESFLDFMVRICNRYGEFLYCEDNTWHIGLENTDSAKDISDISSSDIAKHESCITEFQDEAILLNPNYLDAKCTDNKVYSEGAIYKKSNGAFSQEYFEQISNKDYAQLSDYVPPVSTPFDLLKSAEEKQNFFDAVVATAIATSMRLGIAEKIKNDINVKYKKYYDRLTDDDEQGKKHEFTRKSNQVDENFYKNILKCEEKTEKKKLEIKYATYNHLALGEKVKYGTDDYVVYGVKGGKEKDGAEYQELTLVPVLEGKVYPLPMRNLHIRKASPQRAVVVNNFDPMRLGRVQVKYPWQPQGGDKPTVDSTPWLRVSYPMASNQSGFMFFPKTGDEVLIDYEEGNIERPFVAGSFYSESNQPSVPASTHLVGAVKSITSDNGHHISFTDLTGGYKFISELIPFIGLLSKFGLLSSAFQNEEVQDKAEDMTKWAKDLRKYLAGGFEIADFLGVYSIKGKTHERNITISSPVGDIVIDAFTGITIKAPHGDVKIVGKNVDIEARNNLTITSGSNIKQPYFASPARIIPVAIGGIMKTVGLDLSFHRTWLEVLMRPIGGTMLIKSYRFLRVEAGEGNTETALKDDLKLTDNPAELNELDAEIQRIIRVLHGLRMIVRIMRRVNNPFGNFLRLQDNDISILNRIINGQVNSEEHLGVWTRYYNDFIELQNSITNLKNKDVVQHNEYLKNLVRIYSDIFNNLKTGLQKMTKEKYERVPLHVLEEYDVCTSNTCRKILFESIFGYVKMHNSLRKVLIMDSSKVKNWNNAKAIKEGIMGGTNRKRDKIGKPILLDPLLSTFSFNRFLDDNCWRKLDDGGIIYSVSKLGSVKITKGNDGHRQEVVTNKNVELLVRAKETITACIVDINYRDIGIDHQA